VTIALTPTGTTMSRTQESHERYAATALRLASVEQPILSEDTIEKRQLENTATELHGHLKELSTMADSSLAVFAPSLLDSSKFEMAALS
jgi:hypothetical protein